MVAINAKVIYHFAVIFAEDILCIPWVPVHLVIGLFYLPRRQKHPEKVILKTFQTNINFHMFQDEFVVKKRFFDERWGFNFIPAKVSDGNEVITAHGT